jgi:hypothetical protein
MIFLIEDEGFTGKYILLKEEGDLCVVQELKLSGQCGEPFQISSSLLVECEASLPWLAALSVWKLTSNSKNQEEKYKEKVVSLLAQKYKISFEEMNELIDELKEVDII